MTADNLEYFQQRAEEELQLARSAGHANAIRAHYTMAGYYLDLVHNEDAQAASEAASETRGTRAGLDDWAARCASKARQEHGEMAGDYVAARIEACRMVGDVGGMRLWEEVKQLVAAAEPPLLAGSGQEHG